MEVEEDGAGAGAGPSAMVMDKDSVGFSHRDRAQAYWAFRAREYGVAGMVQ